MNQSSEDKILDSFLEEMLTNQRPPDLNERIQQRLREELGPERFRQLRSAPLGSKTVRTNSASSPMVRTERSAWPSITVVC